MGLMLTAFREKLAKGKSPFGGKEEDSEGEGFGADAKAEAAEILGLDKEKSRALEAFIRACRE